METKFTSKLHYAAYHGKVEVILKLLQSKKVDINKKDDNFKNYPLHLAIKKDHTEIVKLLLQKGADPNLNGGKSSDSIPLILAIRKENYKIVKLLVQKGAYINLLCGEIITPLELAISNENFKIVKLLLSKGANQDLYGSQIPLEIAFHTKKLKIIKLLIDHGADLNQNTVMWESYPPYLKLYSKMEVPLIFWPIKEGNLEILELLIQKGANFKSVSAKQVQVFTLR